MSFLLHMLALLESILDAWVQAHPEATLAIIAAEVTVSLVASQLPTPTEKSSGYYHALFIVFSAFAINPARVGIAWNVLRGNKAALPPNSLDK